MTFIFEPELRQDWKGVGDWDDMEVPVNGTDRYRLAYAEKRRADRLARDAAKPKVSKPGREWPEDEINLLRKLWGEGKSASEISLLLGNRSRSAVLGRVARLGLQRFDYGETSKQSSLRRSRSTYKPRRGVKPKQSLGKGAGRIADSRPRTAPVVTAEVIDFPALPDLLEDFDAFDPLDLHLQLDRLAA